MATELERPVGAILWQLAARRTNSGPGNARYRSFFESSQQNVTGDVFVQLMPYRFQIIGIESPYDLMSSKFGKYGEMNMAGPAKM